MTTRGVLEANLLIEEEDRHNPQSNCKRTKFLAEALEEGDPLRIVAGDCVIETVVKSSGCHRTARMVNGKLVRGL